VSEVLRMPPEPRGHRRTLAEAEKAERQARAEINRFRPILDEVRRVESRFAAQLSDRRQAQQPFDGQDRRR
jgi:hypothetical protein